MRNTIEVEHHKTRIEVFESIKSPLSQGGSANDLNSLSRRLLDLNLSKRNVKTEQAILDSLYLPQLSERYHRIVDAHNNTFEWIFKNTPNTVGSQRSDNDFNKWLSQGSGSYWITGKPGSGKSTLMKFICGDRRTRIGLEKWAGTTNLVTASFYFWMAGVPIQKSLIGLLQSLFYTMLKGNRSLIPKLFPWRWRTYESHGASAGPWTENEFLDALRILKTEFTQTAKFCFFIDGLDEYEGDHEWLVEFAKELSGLPHVKLCISSRPEIVFEDAFAELPMLCVQDLTHDDIKQFAGSTLGALPNWPQLCRDEPDKGPKLIDDISAKSSGVFLWVYLVIRSLKDGLRNKDSISDLQRRVDGFPSGLDEFFMHILGRLDPFYLQQTKKYFRIAIESGDPLSLMTYSFTEEEDPRFGEIAPLTPFSREDVLARCEKTRLRLKSRCKDLLEVYVENGSARAFMAADHSYVKPSVKGLPLDALNMEHFTKVSFLHRTVRDFLETPGAKLKLVATENDNFDASNWLLQATLAQIKGMSKGFRKINRRDAFKQVISPMIPTVMKLASSGVPSSFDFLDELDRAAVRYCRGMNHWTSTWFWGFNNVLPLAVALHLTEYLEARLQCPGLYRDKDLKERLLVLALLPTSEFSLNYPDDDCFNADPDVTTVRLLLEAGANPDKAFLDPWPDKMQDQLITARKRFTSHHNRFIGPHNSQRQETRDRRRMIAKAHDLFSQSGYNESTEPQNESSERDSNMMGMEDDSGTISEDRVSYSSLADSPKASGSQASDQVAPNRKRRNNTTHTKGESKRHKRLRSVNSTIEDRISPFKNSLVKQSSITNPL